MESPRQKSSSHAKSGDSSAVRDLSGFLPKLVKGVLSILSENATHRHVTEDLSVDEPLANVSEEAADAHSKQPYGDCSHCSRVMAKSGITSG
jgi:hypothetical protein